MNNTDLTRFNGKVHSDTYSIENRIRWNHPGDTPVEFWGLELAPFFLTPDQKSLGAAAGSKLSPRLGQQFMSKRLFAQSIRDAASQHLQSFSIQSLIEASLWVRNLSTSRNKSESHFYSRGDPGMLPTAMKERWMGPGLCMFMGWVIWLIVMFVYQLYFCWYILN